MIRIEPEAAEREWTVDRSWVKVSERKYTSAVILSSSWRQTILKQFPEKNSVTRMQPRLQSVTFDPVEDDVMLLVFPLCIHFLFL